MFQRILLGIVLMLAGFFMVWKTDFFYRLLGRISTGERLFGFGGTRFFLKLAGIVLIFVGFFLITRFHERILEAIFGRIY